MAESGDVSGSADWVAVDEQEGPVASGAADATDDPFGRSQPDDNPDSGSEGGATSRSGTASVSPSAPELVARRESVDLAASRVLEEEPDTAAPLAFCGLSAVVEPLDDA